MNSDDLTIAPDWKWGTSEGSRDLDRLLDRQLTFREKLEWLEEAETLSLHFQALRRKATPQASETSDGSLADPPA